MERNGATRLFLTIAGSVVIAAGIGLLIVYLHKVQPEKEARELLVEGKLAYEREDKDSINNSINLFSKIIARYPDTKSADEAIYLIGQGYEKLGLNRLAYLKYVYILKNTKNLSQDLANDIRVRLSRLKIMREHTEEGIDQLLGLVNYSSNNDFRSRIYTELGHAYLKEGDYKKARRMFDIALSENGGNEEAILGKARSFIHLGDDNKAYDLYEYFLKYYGNFSQYAADVRKSFARNLYDSGMRSYRRGSYYPAIEYFKRYLSNFPGDRKVENSLYWIGESYFGLKKYTSAATYFGRVLGNTIYTKDEDALIKRGYSYFMEKKFDLAAREFQTYIEKFPGGKNIETARKWKEMSTKEIMYRIEKDRLPDDDGSEIEQKDGTGTSSLDEKETGREREYGVSGGYNGPDYELENIAEL
ncbi:MAG TPA: tetratricopeptide repeat protein [Spirochaetota bacterium]|nr:tetratricopeptide repeat protein [Spirochaetota bacterium]HRZ26886.1 tetratricopeptide repeat protein [Spirochaetota bacterium]HSA15057.1 tetratricopeptide repeat protein [Spirochaetota bacterium]